MAGELGGIGDGGKVSGNYISAILPAAAVVRELASS
jgi:hypothetical protein